MSVRTCARYVAEGKDVLGDEQMSDRRLGEHLGFAQQTIAKAKAGRMSDSVALALGKLLELHGRVAHAGEVVVVAHAERDCDPSVRATLMDYAKKVLASVPVKAANALAACAVALGLLLPSQPAEAALAEPTASAKRRRWTLWPA